MQTLLAARWQTATPSARAFTVATVSLLTGAALYALAVIKAGAFTSRESLAAMALLFAAFIGSIAGFAFSAIAGALLVHLYPNAIDVVSLLFVCSISIQIYCTFQLCGEIRWHELAPYVLGGMLTAPLGTWMLMSLSTRAYALVLGTLISAFAAYSLLKPISIRVTRSPLIDGIVGALGGITGGIAAFPSAFATIWCSARGLTKEAQRAICQPYILILQIWSLACLQRVHRTTALASGNLWLFVPISVVGAMMGFSVYKRLNNDQFRRVILTVLTISGVVLIARAI